MEILIILAVVFYSSAISLQVVELMRQQKWSIWPLWMLGVLGCVAHAMLLHRWIDQDHLQNLSVLNLFSLIAWLVTVLILLTSLRKPVISLGIFAFPIALFSIVLVISFSSAQWMNVAASPQTLIHILLSTLTISILGLAALQAVLLGIQNWFFKRKKCLKFIDYLPPLEVMESLLFQMLRLGFVFLTILLLTSLSYFYQVGIAMIWKKALLGLLAWLVFAGLLIGHRVKGWRGQVAIRYTLSGVVLVTILYYGSQLL